jgi:hypothetical protein
MQRTATAMATAPNVAAAEHVWMQGQAHAAMASFEASARAGAGMITTTTAGADDVQPVPAAFSLFAAPLISAGHLTGSGRRVVLEARLNASAGDFRMSMIARDSRTGRSLWARQGPRADQEVLPLALSPVGKPAKPGLLMLQLSVTPLSKHSFSETETIAAWSGKTGKTVWTSAPLTGTATVSSKSFSLSHAPGLPDVFRALPGRALDALIASSTFTERVDSPSPSPATTSAVLIDGTDGASTTPYGTLSSDLDPPNLLAVNDLDGDGLGDVLAIIPGDPGSIAAERGDTGTEIWSHGALIDDVFEATQVGRLTGGRIGDLVIQGDDLTLIRGRDGKVLWTRRPFAQPFALGRVGRHHVPALALVEAMSLAGGSSTGANFDTDAVTIRAVTASNRVVWKQRVAATIHPRGSDESGSDSTGSETIGDVQPDGALDFAVHVSVRSAHKHAAKSGVVDGRTGRFRSGPVGAAAAGSLVRGRGSDLLRKKATADGIELSGYDGATGVRILHRLMATPGHTRQAFAVGLRATGHRCSDIEAGALFRKHHVIIDLLSGSGARLWSLRYNVKRATAGRVVRYEAPKHFCAK